MPLLHISDPTSPAVELSGVGVRYRLPRGGTRSIKEFSLLWLKRQIIFDDFWAIREIDLRVYPGERLGVVGRNGAGKSTLLQVIARVSSPSTGTGSVRGRVAPLLQLGAGFDQQLTGRENVFLNGTLLGMRRSEINERFDEIVEFAEIGSFIDQPLRTYSSGMSARLGFAVATTIQPDVLLVDEVLAVGDEAFRARCEQRMLEFSDRGTTMVVVSHSAEFVRSNCTRAIWLDGGRIQQDGAPEEVVSAYQRYLRGEPQLATVAS